MTASAQSARQIVKDGHRDSTQWDAIDARRDDIVIVSCYKSGTTLTQQIVNLLINGTSDFERLRNVSPWVDAIGLHIGAEKTNSLPSPRFLKSHLPFDALPQHPGWRYIYLARDGRDVCLSLYDHCQQLKRDRPVDERGNPIDYGNDDFSTFYDEWLEYGHPYWPLWDHVDNWWQVRKRQDVLLLHYDTLSTDKPAQIRVIAEFLGLPYNDAIGQMVYDCSSLDYMKGLELEGKLGKPGPKQEATFVNKGIKGRWRGRLTDAQTERYFKLLYDRLERECADWIRSD